MSKWKYDKLSTLCDRIGDGLHGTPNYSESSDIYFINGNNLKNGKIEINENTKRVVEDELENNFIPLNKNSLLLSINGTIGSLAFYNDEKVMLGKSSAYLNFTSDINSFYYYYFQLKSIQEKFYNIATGSTIKNLSLKSIQDFEVPIPEDNEWKPIASVLSSLDAKIELNNRINAELEAMAKTMYDYWFVQFDFPTPSPLGEGTGEVPYKSSGGKMVYHEDLKREIPEGWQVKNLFDVCKVQYGFPFSTNYFNEDGNGVPVIRIRDILENSVTNHSTENNIDVKYLIKKGDLLIGMDGNFHINYWTVEGCYLNQRVVKLSETLLPNIYIKYQVEPYIKLREQSVSRTTVGHLSDKDLKAIKILVPSKKVIESINILYKSSLNKIIQNKNENQQLSQLRDWLLPMLMNGQVTVKDAYGMVDEQLSMAAEEREGYGE